MNLRPRGHHLPGRRRPGLSGLRLTGLLCAGALVLTSVTAAVAVGGRVHVGATGAHGVVLPTGQSVSPYGRRIKTSGGRLLSSTMSPDGRHVAALSYRDSAGFLSIFDVAGARLAQQVGSSDAPLGDGTVSADGPIYSPDGTTLWVPQTSDVLRFAVAPDGTVATTPTVIATKSATGTPYLPSGGAFSADGTTLYLALNNVDAVAEVDAATGTIRRQIPVGVAPRQVVLTGGRLFVSDEGGRHPGKKDFTNLSSASKVAADRRTGAVNNGTLSVVDLASGRVRSLRVGLQPTAMLLRGAALYVANSNADSVSVVDVRSTRVVQTFGTNPLPGSHVGSYPNALAMPDPSHLLVSIGRDNALAVYRVSPGKPRSPVRYQGLVPTDWYPVALAVVPGTHRVVVTNDKGIGSRGLPKTITEGPDAAQATGLNTYSDTGSLTVFDQPATRRLKGLTHTVFVDNGWDKALARGNGRGSRHARAVAIPKRLGSPSKIKHVFLLVKENRTYDQVLGDLGRGNGDPSLTQFGAAVTPNHHALAKQFADFDNFYDEGTLSADGHNWLMQADANDYIEKEFGAFYRSYPAQGGDALAYQRVGFLWNAARAAGRSVRNFGEYNNFFTADNDPNRPTWADWYQDSLILEGKASGPLPVPIDKYRTYADIPSLNAITDHTYPKFDTDVPDQYRTDIWLKSFRQSQRTGKLANLNLLWVPDDHTAGTSGASPYPTAAVADNDLAVGRIVDAISHSRFWKSSAVFVVEDDSQAGTDHVDGHRSPVLIASPYARRGIVDSTYYTQLNVVRTIEQILGIAPMNQMDRAAVPMFDAFTDKARTGPYQVRANQVPLTYGLLGSTAAARVQSNGTTPSQGRTKQVPRRVSGGAAKSAAPLPAGTRRLQRAWAVWSRHQGFGGSRPEEDKANPAQLNRLDWYSATGWTKPYPGDPKLLGPYEVPGWDRPAAEIG